MKRWIELFGAEYNFELKDDERKYFGLERINDNNDISVFNSVTNNCFKKTTVFWNKDNIIKVIVEENRCVEGTMEVFLKSYNEYDTLLKTDNRIMLLPLTERGKPKKITATNVLNIAPFGCSFYVCVSEHKDTILTCYNPRNNKTLAIGEALKIENIKNNKDFRNFIEYYISTCPNNYFEKIDILKNKKHQTIKYKVGDIFRIELDRFNYSYGLITAELKTIKEKIKLPKDHSLNSRMMVPLMVRFYNLETTNPNIKLEELLKYDLSDVQICADNDIIWGQHDIVYHKDLEETDLDFNFIAVKFTSTTNHTNIFTEESLVSFFKKKEDKFNIYIEWGFASLIIPYKKISTKLIKLFSDYRCPYNGVQIGVYKRNYIKNPNFAKTKEIKKEIMKFLKLNPDISFDEFALKYNGLTKSEILEKLK